MTTHEKTLNCNLEFQNSPPQVQRAFLGHRAEKKRLEPFHQLYRFHGVPSLKPGAVTAWWSSVEPINSLDCGLEQLSIRAERLGAPVNHFARTQNAVARNWGNSMKYLITVELYIPVYAFVGRASHQLIDETDPGSQNVFFIGGAVQLWIPNLDLSHIRICNARETTLST